MKCCDIKFGPPVDDQEPIELLERRIVRKTGRAVGDFGLIEDGDRIMVAVSGGKDSYSLLHALELLRRRAPVDFSLVAVNLHHGFPEYRADKIEAHLREFGFEYHMATANIAHLLETKIKPGKSYCPLCARLRRGKLYGLAPKLGCNKIALGHHKDDLVETLLLNIFFTGQLKSMPPKLLSDDGRNIVIRPLAYVDEHDLAAYARRRGFAIVCCSCPACGVRDNQQRRAVKAQLARLERAHPGLRSSIMTAMRNVIPSHLMDDSVRLKTDDSKTQSGPR
jgi:tRNA 2-thiocytidine biosynthesis protein TtcA